MWYSLNHMDLKKIFHWLILLGIGLVPFLPLFVSHSLLFPFISGKNFAFRIIVELIFALWLILAFWDKKYRPQKSLIIYSVLAFLVVATLATIFGVSPYHSFWSNFERMDGLINLLHLGVFFVVLVSILKSEDSWFKLFYVSLAANALVLFYGFGQLLGMAEIHQGGVRLDASLGNAAYLATYCLFHVFIGGYLFFRHRSLRWLFVLSIIANLVILYFTATRGAILGLIGGVLLTTFILLLRNWSQPKIRKIFLFSFLAILILIALFWILKDTAFVQSSPVLSRFASISLTETTTRSRFLIWQMAWQGFKEKPILGWGPGNFGYVFAKHYNPLMWRQEPWFDRAHNIIFDWLINAGLLGLLSYLSILFFAFYYLGRKFWRSEKDSQESKNKQKNKLREEEWREKAGTGVLVGLLAAYFFQNLFVFDNLTSYTLFFIVLAYVHFISVGGGEGNAKPKNFSDNELARLLVTSTLVGVLLVASLYQLNFKPIAAGKNVIGAIRTYPDSAINLDYYQKVFAADTFVSGEAREQLLSKTLSVLDDENLSENLRNQFGQLALDEWSKQLERFSEDTRSRFYFGSFLSAVGMFDQALINLQKAKELSPQKQMTRLELATLHFKMNKPDLAMAELKETFELEPGYPEARKMYALGAIIVGESELAAEIIEPIKDSEEYFLDDRFVYYYNEANDRAKLNDIHVKRAGYYSDLTQNNPENLENFLKLAEAQIALGQNVEAKKSLQVIIDLAKEEQKTLKTKAENLLQTI